MTTIRPPVRERLSKPGLSLRPRWRRLARALGVGALLAGPAIAGGVAAAAPAADQSAGLPAAVAQQGAVIALPDAQVGKPYYASLTSSGLTGICWWQVSASGNAGWVTHDAGAPWISGTPPPGAGGMVSLAFNAHSRCSRPGGLPAPGDPYQTVSFLFNIVSATPTPSAAAAPDDHTGADRHGDRQHDDGERTNAAADGDG